MQKLTGNHGLWCQNATLCWMIQ